MNVPPLGDSVTKGEIVEWIKKVGDYCAEDEELCTMETDKVTFPVRCSTPGEIVEIFVETDAEVRVGEPLLRFKKADGPGNAAPAAPASPEPKAADPVPEAASTSAPAPASSNGPAVGTEWVMNVPPLGDSVTKGEIVEWLKNVGDYCGEDEELCTMETDKVTFPVRCSTPGEIVEIYVDADAEVRVGEPLLKFRATEASASATPASPAASAPAPETTPEPVAAAPKAEAPKSAAPASTPSKAPEAAPGAMPGFSSARTEKRVKISPMRRKIAERLVEGQSTAATLTTFNEVDMTNLMNMRKKYKDAFEKKHGAKLGFMSAFVAAATSALQDQPIVNAVIDDKEIVYREYCDISIAVSSPRGLVVPVLRDTQNMSLWDIEKATAELAARARSDQITVEEMAGGTFTITNGGVFGSLFSTPMLNMPQSAILGMHGIKERPVTVDGQVVSRPMMYIALTYDHRIVDGRESVVFLKSIKEKCEDPERLIFGV